MLLIWPIPSILMSTCRVFGIGIPPGRSRLTSDLAGTNPTAPARARHSQHLGRGHATKRPGMQPAAVSYTNKSQVPSD
jgi:hypothetical protein